MAKITEQEALAMNIIRFDSQKIDGIHAGTVFTVFDVVEKQSYEWIDNNYVLPVDPLNLTTEEKAALRNVVVDYLTQQEKQLYKPVVTYDSVGGVTNKTINEATE